MKLKTLIVACLMISSSCAFAEKCNSLHSFAWLLGDWVADNGKNLTLESWKAVSPDTYEGVGETRSRTTNELLNSESLRIVAMSGEIFFVAKVDHNDLPVAFKLTDCSSDRAVFENAAHDFPRKLEYRLVNDDKILVTVTDGATQGFKVSFTRRDDK